MDRYKDPLHAGYEELVVRYRGKEVHLISKMLLDRQNAWRNLDKIKGYHRLRLYLYDIMKNTDDPVKLARAGKISTEIEFRLQELWFFPRNKNYHAFWNLPKCRCPRLDNIDAYPTGHYITAADCPIHGTVGGGTPT